MKRIDLFEIFKNINVNYKLKMIGDLFIKNAGEQDKINYKPPFQRNYVWPLFKGTYFIETLLLHAEFSPIVAFVRELLLEVIDGRQRCETIDLFLRDQLYLKSSGLDKLWYLADKNFSQLTPSLRDRIESTKLRVIHIEFKDKNIVTPALEEVVKREFFRRYNLGITPLKKEEVYKAQYLKDELNIYFKNKFKEDKILYTQICEIFDHRSKNIEILMQHIRQLLVLHRIPINRFVSERDDIVNIYYDFLSYYNNGIEKVRNIFNDFKKGLSFCVDIRLALNKELGKTNGLIYECLYWAYSISVTEKAKLDKIQSHAFKAALIKHLTKQISIFSIDRNNQANQIKNRFQYVASFFSRHLGISFDKYMKNADFVIAHRGRIEKYRQERFMPGQEQEYFSKSTPTSTTIRYIADQMKKEKFEIQPPYQREEVQNRRKASALIESILLNIKLHPIFIFVRKDGVREVIDGQQRLLTMLAFIGQLYRNSQGEMVRTKKHQFSLRLKTGVMQHLNGEEFSDLSPDLQRRILDFELEMIEILEENNPHFKPEDLFKRLNYKPFPIKENSFEFWNAYVDGEIISKIKSICQKNPWLYLRKNNTRMLNEELITHFIYLQYLIPTPISDINEIKDVLNFELRNEQILITFNSKSNITRTLENETRRQDFVEACGAFEFDFLAKVKVLTYHPDGSNSDLSRGRQLDNILHATETRTLQKFYLLWIILKGISIETVSNFRTEVREFIDNMFAVFEEAKTIEEVTSYLIGTWPSLGKYRA